MPSSSVEYTLKANVDKSAIRSSSEHLVTDSNNSENAIDKTRKYCSEGTIIKFCALDVEQKSLDWRLSSKKDYHKNCVDRRDTSDTVRSKRPAKARFGLFHCCCNGACKYRTKCCGNGSHYCAQREKAREEKNRIQTKIEQLAQPKKYTPKYDPSTKKEEVVISTVQPAALSYELTERTEDLALPAVSTIVSTKQKYSKIFDKQRQKILTRYAKRSIQTIYSKMANVPTPNFAKYAKLERLKERKKKKHDPDTNKYTISERLVDLAMSNVRSLLGCEEQFKAVLPQRLVANLGKQIQLTLGNIYQKYKHRHNKKKKKTSKKPPQFLTDMRRTVQLALPRVRSLVSNKSKYRHILDRKHNRKLDRALKASLETPYSKMAKVELPPVKERPPKWTEADWERYMLWMYTRGCRRHERLNPNAYISNNQYESIQRFTLQSYLMESVERDLYLDESVGNDNSIEISHLSTSTSTQRFNNGGLLPIEENAAPVQVPNPSKNDDDVGPNFNEVYLNNNVPEPEQKASLKK